VGIGGVGGYFGGLLAQKYAGGNEVEIIFLARGKHFKQIQAKGLKVIKGKGEFIAVPALATSNSVEAGVADFIFICTKSYHLEAAIEQIKPCIGSQTVLLPLLNGVDASERIKKILPEAIVADGCAYIISRIKEAGTVENTGNVQTIYFGMDNTVNERLQLLEKILKAADIDAVFSDKISTIVWEKFIFISATATATSFFNCSVGKLVEEHEDTVTALVREVQQIALAKKIDIDRDMVTKVLNRQKSIPYDATSSMHSDFKDKKPQTELASLTGYVVKAGKELGIDTPVYNRLYEGLLEKKQ
jgi:2-dehydropantoate 2-reductase